MEAECSLHADKAAEATCLSCAKKICRDCVVQSVDHGYCPACGNQRVHSGKRHKVAMAATALLVAAGLVGALVFLSSRPTPARVAELANQPEKGRSGLDDGKHAGAVARLRRQLEADSCNKRFALELGEKLNQAGDYSGALTLVNGFTERCGLWTRLLWVASHAHKQRREWKEAAAVNTQLIEDRPDDSDFWWWRAEALASAGEYEQAAADYHQSMANLPNGFAAGRYAQWGREKLGRPCDGAFALQYWLEQRPKEAEDWAKAKRSELYLAGGCDKLVGKGRTTIRFAPNAPVIKTPATLNGRAGTLLVSLKTGYTLITQSFADQLGLAVPEQPVVTVYVAGEYVPARVTRLEKVQVGTAQVEGLTAAVVERLPAEVAGALGVNFFWRFSVKTNANGIMLGQQLANR